MTSASLRVYDNKGISVTLVRDDVQNETVMVATFHKVRLSVAVDESVTVSGTVRRTADGQMSPQRIWVQHSTGAKTGNLDFNENNADEWANAAAARVIVKMNDLADEFVHQANDDRLRSEIEKNAQQRERERMAKKRAEQQVENTQRQHERAIQQAVTAATRTTPPVTSAVLLAGMNNDGTVTIALEQPVTEQSDTARLLASTTVDDDLTLNSLRDMMDQALILRAKKRIVRFAPQPKGTFSFLG